MAWEVRPTVVMLLTIGFTLSSAQWSSGPKRVKEKDLQVITLQEGKYTTARRTSPVPQLRCLSGCSQTPKTVQCYNRGWDGSGNNWECKAALPHGVTFGQMDVNCEGFDYPDDPYITAGSCSLSYHLIGQQSHSSWRPGKSSNYKSESGGIMFNLLFYGVVVIIVVSLYKSCVRSVRSGPGGGDGGPWGPGNQGFYGMGGPPPGGPGFRPDFYPPGDGCGGTRPPPPAYDAGPGFWSGAAAGGILGYLFGNRNDGYGYGGDYDYTQQRRPRFQGSSDDDTRFRGDNSYPDSSRSQSSSGFATSSRR